MRHVKILVKWTKSKCKKVDGQLLTVNLDGKPYVEEVELDGDVEQYTFWTQANTVVEVVVVAVAGVDKRSDACKLTFIVPDTTRPIPPSDVVWTVLEDRDTPPAGGALDIDEGA
jgi:hypothetical protein